MEKPAAPPPAFTGYQKFLVAVLALLMFSVILDFMVLSPLGDTLIKSLSITPAQFGTVVSAYAFSAGASGILSAGFADRFDRKKLLLFFYTGFIMGTLACGLAQTYHLLLAARVVAGLFGGVIGSVMLAIVADEFSIQQRGRVMGMVQMAFGASQVLGIPVGLYLANRWDWHAPFLLIVGLALGIGAAIVVKMRPINRHLALQRDTNAFEHLWHAVSKPAYQTGFLSTTFLAIGGFMLMPFGSAFLINNVHLTNAQLPVVYLFTGISSLILMPLVGRLSDKVSKFGLFVAGSVLAGTMVLIYTNIGPSPLWQVIVLNVLMFAGITGRMVPSATLNASVPDAADRGAYMGLTSSLQQLAGGLGTVVAGLIVHQATKTSPLENYNVLGYIVVGVFAACLFFVYRVSQMVARKQREAVPAAAAVAVE